LGSKSTIILKEHQYAPLPKGFDTQAFIDYLDEVWKNRLVFGEGDMQIADTGEYSTNQPFFSFTYDGQIKAKNYVGFTHWEGYRFEVLPKVFGEQGSQDLWPHLTYWLSYCRNIHFPFSSLDTVFQETSDFPEALIQTFALFTRSIVQNQPFSQYEDVIEVSPSMKGKLDFNRYLNQQFSKGSPHRLVVEHSPLRFNNLLNQIIKSVATRLQGVCRFESTFHLLQDILFQLEEVDTTYITAADCDRVHINRLFEEYAQVLDMCRFFLREGQLSDEMGAYQNFSFMIPMEVVFEDFVAGFLEAHFSDRFEVSYQSRGWLTDELVFQLRYDILLRDRSSGQELIIDTKYKIRQKKDSKQGIRQGDMYQMLAYAVRRGCDRVLLLYPGDAPIDSFSISSEMFSGGPIRIFSAGVSFVSADLSVSDGYLEERLGSILNEI
jgi:5-methylcytosine-specific restriction enzyme subunit McrC